jgi:hypothetical protein
MINHHAAFLSEEFRVAAEKKNGSVFGAVEAVSKKCGGNEACATIEGERIDHEAMMHGDLPKVTWDAIIEHIDHAVKIAGVDRVGLGSDFDGSTMPLGMEDASKLPKITDTLLKTGCSDADVEKILGGNILRMMEASRDSGQSTTQDRVRRCPMTRSMRPGYSFGRSTRRHDRHPFKPSCKPRLSSWTPSSARAPHGSMSAAAPDAISRCCTTACGWGLA